MKDFEVKVRRGPNSKVKAWRVRAKDADVARAAAERMLRLSGAKSAQVLSVKEIVAAG